MLRAVQERLIVPPARLNPAVSAALDAAVMRALERERARRWPSAHELERALAEVVLAGARSLEDTDVGAFLRRMFPEETGVAEPVPGHGSIPISLSSSGGSGEPPRRRCRPSPVPSGGRRPRWWRRRPSEPGPTEVLPGRAERAGGGRCGVLAVAAVAAAAMLAVARRTRARRRREPEHRAAPGAVEAFREATGRAAGTPAGSPRAPLSQGDPAAASSARLGPAAAPQELEPAGDPGGRGAKAGERRPRARLVIRAKPWAELRVDGKRAGYVQGSKTVRLPAGRHVVELTGPDGSPVPTPCSSSRAARPGSSIHPPSADASPLTVSGTRLNGRSPLDGSVSHSIASC